MASVTIEKTTTNSSPCKDAENVLGLWRITQRKYWPHLYSSSQLRKKWARNAFWGGRIFGLELCERLKWIIETQNVLGRSENRRKTLLFWTQGWAHCPLLSPPKPSAQLTGMSLIWPSLSFAPWIPIDSQDIPSSTLPKHSPGLVFSKVADTSHKGALEWSRKEQLMAWGNWRMLPIH